MVYPRIEATFRETTRPDETRSGKLSIGIEGLDAMLGGGLPEATVAALVGPTGVGKTILGLHFLNQSSAVEPGLLFGFYETPARLLQKADRLGLDLKGAVDRGHVEILWQVQGENVQDALAHGLLDAITRRGVRRLFLDGLGGLIQSSVEPSRLSRFLAVLTNELRARAVTTLYTWETQEVIGPGIQMPVMGISSLLESLIALRYVEHRSRTRRLLSIVKVRDSDFDANLREFSITDRGISMAGTFDDAQQVLSGFARNRTDHPPGPEGK